LFSLLTQGGGHAFPNAGDIGVRVDQGEEEGFLRTLRNVDPLLKAGSEQGPNGSQI